MAGDLAVLPTDGAEGRPVPVLVTTADADANRKFFHEHGIRCPALLQEKMEVASQYKASGTPMGYLIDEQGRIASVVAAGAPAVLSLAGRGSLTAEAAESAEKGAKEHKGNRSLADSRLQRSGLPVGTPAPEFTLPRVEGGELSLSEYRGRKVLLVFSDPHCGPCNALAPQLEQSYRRSGDVQVVLISRGEVEENHAKVAEHGLTFPVVLQRKWEVSKEYAMFATPVGYLIDENGLTAAAAAVGTDAILKLLAGAASQAPAPVPGKKCPCGKIAGECACARKNGRALAEKR
jgi:peroxiredoxin